MKLYFEVQVKKTERADNYNSVTKPVQLPGFVLCHNYNWDDNGFHNWYALHYFDADENWHLIGELHLMHESGESKPKLQDSFQALSEGFCSLGNKIDYYEGLYRSLGTELSIEVLAALQDSAVNLLIYEKYKDHDVFKLSLRRETFDTERALRMARFTINGRKLADAFHFKYLFRPPYNTECVTEWTIDFRPKVHPFMRLVGVIGENGVGKTQMLYSFITDLLNGKKDAFNSELPVFSSVIAICSTPFDAFMSIDNVNYTIPYIKSCVEQNIEETEEIIWTGIKAINERGFAGDQMLMKKFVGRLERELSSEDFSDVFEFHDSGISVLRRYDISREPLHQLIVKLSSGQLQMLMLLTMVYQYVNYDTLFVIDEPEVHLHPNAIMAFLRLMSSILDDFQSYAIITTHSPLVVREMVGRNVFSMHRLEENNVYIGHCDRETFGEDIGILYKEIFGYDDNKSCFREQVKELVNKGANFDEVINALGVENLSLNSRFTIRNMVEEYKRLNR
jgi:ABC-type cobalamin/Fe3+-siderophores transport system ATPase subunit